MRNNAVACLRIRSVSKCALNVLPQMVKKFQICLQKKKHVMRWVCFVAVMLCYYVVGIVASFVRAVSEAYVSCFCS